MPSLLIADDHDLVRETIAAYLSTNDLFKVCTVSSLDGALAVLNDGEPFDLVILDYNMPGMFGLTGLTSAINKHPQQKFAIMSGIASTSTARDAMDNGAVAFFPKSLTAGSMVDAIKSVINGEVYFPFGENEDIRIAKESEFYGLTVREKETLLGLCDGKSNKEIARELDLQEVTIKLHVKNILSKLDVKNRTQAALKARDELF